MTGLRLQFVAWRLGVAHAFAALLLPPYSLRRLRALVFKLGGVDVALGSEVAGWTKFGHPNVHVGRGSFLGPCCVLVATRESAIQIGERVAIGPGVMMVTATHEIGPATRRAGIPASAPIVVGNGAWIGAHATLLPGVVVGAGAVVAGGAVVTTNVKSDSMVGGVPARPIRSLGSSPTTGSLRTR